MPKLIHIIFGVLMIFLILSDGEIYAQNIDRLVIEYEVDVYFLNDGQRIKIRRFFEKIDSVETKSMRVSGSADFLGNKESNKVLSDHRVQQAIEYIQFLHGQKKDKIKAVSKGEMPYKGVQSPEGHQPHRTVIIEVFNNEISTNVTDLGTLLPGSTIRLKHLNFHPGRHVLVPKSVPILKELEEQLLYHDEVNIEIHGHVCCMEGSKHPDGYDIDDKNHKLSYNRAKNIYNYLVLKGIDSARLDYKGFGFSKPLIYPETTDIERAENRRVELLIVEY